MNFILLIKCKECEATLAVDPDEYSIHSTDQGHEFWALPNFRCGECGNLCEVILSEKSKNPKSMALVISTG